MTVDKRNIVERLKDTEQMARTLANSPKKKKTIATMVTNSFIAGLEAGRNLEKTAV